MPSYSMPDTDLHEFVAAYALDALDDDERTEFERHLGTCERCAAERDNGRHTSAAWPMRSASRSTSASVGSPSSCSR